ncbi:MAG: hypothetical protein K8T89_02950 [Planctomycetes bacterium]|nr:hypothetical protein [Planctomycetota bacterium]
MTAFRTANILALLLLPTVGFAQNYNLSEIPNVGENYRVSIETTLTGSMTTTLDGKQNVLKISARNDHSILERSLIVEKGVIRKSARYYEKAMCQADVGDEKVKRSLRSERLLIVAQRQDDRLFCYSPAGPMSRAELEVVAEHFDTQHITGLLPDKEVTIEDTWKISNATAQALSLFEGLVSHDLTGKLTEVKDGRAIIVIEGKANGIELGASVKLEIKATVRYELLNHRIEEIKWVQKDAREQGPASPNSELESMTIVKRTFLAEEPKELSKSALVSVPADEPQEILKLLQFKDAHGRFTFLHTRDWHVVGQTDHHLVLRLLDRGDFIAQATVTAWRTEAPGKHASPEEFKKLLSESPGWDLEGIVEANEVPADDGRWIYRVTARGDLDGTKVVQNFFLLAGPKGEQLVVTFTMKPANAAKIGTRDLALVHAIEVLSKK